MMKKNVLVIVAAFASLQMQAQRVLQLEDCRQLALSHNKSLQMAKESVKAATELKKAAFTQFLPNFSANGVYTWNQKNISMLGEDAMLPIGTKMADGSFGYTPGKGQVQETQLANGAWVPLDASGTPFDPRKNPEKLVWKQYAYLPKEAFEFDSKNIFVGTIGFTQPIFMGGKIRELYRISKYSENIAKAKEENEKNELMVEVDEAYWRVVSVENKLNLAKEYRNLIARMDSNVTNMIEEGVTTKAELLKVKVKLNEAEVMVTKAENGLSLSKMALNQLIGLPLDEAIKLSDTDLSNIKETKLIPVEQAISNRPEMKMLTEAQNIAKSSERIMFSRFLPNVALSGNYLVSNPNVYDGYENKFGGMFTVGVVANVPLFHFGERVHTLNAAKVQARIAEMKIDETKEKMQLQIKQDSYKLAESLKKRNTTQQNIDHAEENLRYASEGFKEGVINSTDLLGAQTAWLSAKSENIDAIIDYKLCNSYLAKSLGTVGK